MSAGSPTISEKLETGSYPDLASPTDSVINADFAEMDAEAQEKQREEWKAELVKTEEEILTLKQVLASKEAHAAGLKRRLGITQWREFNADMAQGLKNIQETQVYKKTAEMATATKDRATGIFSNLASTASYINVSEKVGSAFGAAKNRMSASLSSTSISGATETTNGNAEKPSTIPEA